MLQEHFHTFAVPSIKASQVHQRVAPFVIGPAALHELFDLPFRELPGGLLEEGLQLLGIPALGGIKESVLELCLLVLLLRSCSLAALSCFHLYHQPPFSWCPF